MFHTCAGIYDVTENLENFLHFDANPTAHPAATATPEASFNF
jgi:hypothetical protein